MVFILLTASSSACSCRRAAPTSASSRRWRSSSRRSRSHELTVEKSPGSEGASGTPPQSGRATYRSGEPREAVVRDSHAAATSRLVRTRLSTAPTTSAAIRVLLRPGESSAEEPPTVLRSTDDFFSHAPPNPLADAASAALTSCVSLSAPSVADRVQPNPRGGFLLRRRPDENRSGLLLDLGVAEAFDVLPRCDVATVDPCTG